MDLECYLIVTWRIHNHRLIAIFKNYLASLIALKAFKAPERQKTIVEKIWLHPELACWKLLESQEHFDQQFTYIFFFAFCVLVQLSHYILRNI